MSKEPTFDASSWSRSDAIFWMFLTNNDSNTNEKTRQKTVAAVTAYFDKNSQSKISPTLTSEQQILKKLSNQFPEVKRVNQASPLLWIKFGFMALAAEITLTNHFIRKYSLWRFERTLRYGAELVTNANKENQRLAFSIGNQTYEGYPLDGFLLSKIKDTDLSSKADWQLTKAIRLKSNRTLSDNVGSLALATIKKCIDIAAKGKDFPEIKKTKIDGRYPCTITREDLTEELSDYFKNDLPYRESTIFRSISKFVACPKARKNYNKSEP